MKHKNNRYFKFMSKACLFMTLFLIVFRGSSTDARDLFEIQKSGILRHLGVPYANFVTGSGDGLDVELTILFARHIGVRYEYVNTSWETVIGDLTGLKVSARGEDVEILGHVPVKGDIIANGLTILPWRQKVLDYSTPVFPTQVWLVLKADSPIKPIKPSGSTEKDIAAVKILLKGHTILGVANTCLEPSLYDLEEAGSKTTLFAGRLNELAHAIIKGEADATLLDVPDALVALDKWPARIKVVGPLSPMQTMACGFSKTSPDLREAFNKFLEKCRQDGTYLGLIKKYYPAVFNYYPEFFKSGV
ncbi:transporter substrate-binding domain-containing protein [Desulfobacula toluolica]|uniref:Predicted ABC transporter, periplasmic binding protein n=1 Tax=Desulfobacula toluolica (strain DSM 7467 / Tol2) TaxID=651182 RepID=K0NMT1_DESTT|nr:transporter substrate-binding domain-containing protein [Desulfobacula toluolica]CCK81955.1 predicted ABC transporter, periplasmic binding protein [Desulfobacula toluolica Tol2]